ncbi:MAG: pyridoxal phosphate-dependent aminotransferase family protein, partial [Phycisphaerae bacterium]|nr:pyridoxal phosphate-dependent aminotransferase family protein [Phycisphaerae bacterium]
MNKRNFEEFMAKNGTEDIFSKVTDFQNYLNNYEDDFEQGLGIQILSPAGPHAKIKNRKGIEKDTLMLGSNSYLNLTTHPNAIAASEKALKKFGYGMGAVSLYAGITDLHRELETLIAQFHHTEDAILFPSGYGTNIGIISALCQKGDIIINDSANHASIFDGCVLSGADIKIYPHNNMKRLEHILSRLSNEQKGRLIITDGVFSMHGDIAKLDEIVQLAQKYHARIMVDDAHGIGIVGPTGRGTAEVYGVEKEIDIKVGMLSKAPGGLGGFCAGKKELINYLRIYARTYFFSTAMPAPLTAGVNAGEKVQRMSGRFKSVAPVKKGR